MNEEKKQEVQVFDGHQFGIIVEEGKPLFNAGDVCEILEYANTADTLKKHCKEAGIAKREVRSSGQARWVNFIDEPNLYRLIARSKMPNAEKFQDWVFEEVLPSIRKHGGYLTPQKIEEVLLNPDTIIRLATDLKNERQLRIAAETRAQEGEKTVLRLLPMAEYSQTVLLSDSLVKMNDIAVHLGVSAIRLNKFLASREVIYKQGDTWYPHAKYRDGEYFDFHIHHYTDMASGETKTKSLLKATEKGRKMIIELWGQEKEQAS